MKCAARLQSPRAEAYARYALAEKYLRIRLNMKCLYCGFGRILGKNEAAGAADARLCHILGPWAE